MDHFDQSVKTVLPDRLVLKGQKLVENAKKLNETFWVILKTLKSDKMDKIGLNEQNWTK